MRLIEAPRLLFTRRSPPGPIIVKSSGGLGNRIYGALNALAYAAKFKVPVHIDWADGMYAERGENVFPLLFDTHGVQLLSKRPELSRPFPPLWQGREAEFQHEFHAGISWHDWPHFAANIDDWHLLGDSAYDGYVYVARSTYQPSVAIPLGLPWRPEKVFWRHLRFSKCAEDFIRQHATETDASWVGVHYRSTDLQTSTSVADIAGLIARTGRKAVYWASDAPASFEEARTLLPGCIFASTPLSDSFPPGNAPLHLTLGPMHRRSHLIGAIADLHSLSRCGVVIRKRNSTFSQFATQVMASEKPTMVIID